MTTRYLVTAVDESSDGMQTSERQAYLEEALAELGVWPSMGGQVAAMNEAVASGITDLAGRIDALDDRYTLLAERLMRNEREGAEAEQALGKRVAALEQQTSTDIDTLGQWDMDAAAIEAMEAAVYDAHHVEWELERERNDLRDEVERLRTALREISTLEGADPDGIVWTWKQLFCKAEDIAKQALEELGVWPSTNAAHTNARMPQRTITVAPIIDDGGYAVYYDDDPDDGLRVDVFPPYDGAPYVNITTQEIDMTPDQAISLSELLRAAARFAGTPEAARPPARPGPGGGDEQ